MNFTEDVS